LVTALVCAAISAPIVLNSAASRWEIASSLVFAASSFALVSSNFTPKLASMPFTFVASWAERAFLVLRHKQFEIHLPPAVSQANFGIAPLAPYGGSPIR
jgi:hypothetical protein